MKMRQTLCWIPALLLAPCAFGLEHLEPETSQFEGPGRHDYDAALIATFKDAYSKDSVLRAIVSPSFFSDSAIALKKRRSNYILHGLTSKKSVWYSAHEDEEGTKFEPVDITECEQSIDTSLGQQLTKVWETMLLATRYQRKDFIGLDGVTYHFSMSASWGRLAGKAWSPEPDTLPGKLVEVTDAMVVYCKSGETDALKKLRVLASQLFKHLSEQDHATD